MKKHVMNTTAVLCAVLFGLAACSSSGSSSDSVSTNGGSNGSNSGKNNNGNNNNGNNNGGNSRPAPAPSAQYSGNALAGTAQNGHNVSATAAGSNTLNSIVLDGTTITLARPGISAGRFTDITESTRHTIASGTFLSYSRFGSYQNTNDEHGRNAVYTFAIGSVTPTAQVPTTGSAVYNGLAVDSAVGGGAFERGTSRFDVDFGAKTINGTINAASHQIPLAGTINGASFAGTKNGINMSGNFYGPNAAELGGVYNGSITEQGNTVKHMGSFGAKQ